MQLKASGLYTRVMKLSVIIPTYNRAKILEQTLRALESQDFELKDFEVVVVNDGSTDKTSKVLIKWKKRKLNLIALKQKNAGQGKARNKALQKATGEVVIFLGDDTIPTPNFLKEHWDLHQKHPKQCYAVLGLIEWHPDLKINAYMRWMTNGSSIFGKFGGHQFAYEKLKRGKKPDFNFFYTSNVSLKRKLLGRNPFDLSFNKYGWEDIELGYRLQKEKGMRMLYNPRAMVYHHHIMDEKGLKKRMEFIGRSAHIIDAKYPELKKVPGRSKKFAFRLLSNPISLLLITILNKLTLKRLQALYYYALSKKYFLKGVRSGYTKH